MTARSRASAISTAGNYGMFLRAAGQPYPEVAIDETHEHHHSASLDTAKAASALPSPTKSPTKISRTATPTARHQHTRNATPPTATAAARRPASTATAKPRTASNLTGPSTLSAAARDLHSTFVNSTATAHTPHQSYLDHCSTFSSRLTTRTISHHQRPRPAARQPSTTTKQTPAARRISTTLKQPQPQTLLCRNSRLLPLQQTTLTLLKMMKIIQRCSAIICSLFQACYFARCFAHSHCVQQRLPLAKLKIYRQR